MKYTVLVGYNLWFLYEEEGLTFENYGDYYPEDDAMELGLIEILKSENMHVVEEREFIPYGYPDEWNKGTIVFVARYSTYEIEADSLTIDELQVTPYKIEYKDQTFWEEDADSETLEIVCL